MVHVGLCQSKKDCYCRDILENFWDVNTRKLEKHTSMCWCYDTALSCTCTSDEDYEKIKKTREQYPTFELWYIHMCETFLLQEKLRQKKQYEFNNSIEKRVKDKLGMVPSYRFITINFPADVSYNILNKHTTSLLRLKIAYNAVVRQEYTNKDMEYHPHIHLLALSDKKRNQIVSELSRKYGLAKNYIDVDYSPAKFKTHCNYIYGIKQSGKDKQINKDNDIKTSLGLPEVIEQGEIEKIKSNVDI